MTALIAGSGYVGRALQRLLLADGQHVWAISRDDGSVEPSPGGVAVRCDLRDGAALRAHLRPLAAEPELDLYFLASPAGRDDQSYREIYLDGLRTVCEAVTPRRLLLVTSTAVYAQDDGSWVDEASLTQPRTFSGRRLLEAERLARLLAPSVVVARFGGIYGPGRSRLLDQLRAGMAIAAANCAHHRNRIHRDDCARMLQHLARLEVPHDTYIGVDDEPADLRQVQAWLCEHLGIDERGLRPAGPPPPGGNKRCSNARLKESGLTLAYPSFRQGYGALLEGLRNTGKASG